MAHHHHEEDDVDDARARAKQSLKDKENRGRFKLPTGITTTFRILKTPADKERGSLPTFMEYLGHREVGPNKRYVRCGNKPGNLGERNCWLCRRADKLRKKGKTKEAFKLTPRKVFAIQIAVLDKDTGELVGPLLWESNSGVKSTALGARLLTVVSSDNSNKYLDHKKGNNFEIKRTGEGIKTEYGNIERVDEPSSVPKGIIKRLRPFADLGMAEYNEERQKAVYYGTEDDKKENDDMAAKKKAKKKGKTRDASDASSSDPSEDPSSSDPSASASSDASDEASSDQDQSSDASDASSSSSSDASDKKTKKKKKKEASDSSSSDASASASSDASDEASDASASASSDASDEASSDASDEASSSDASDDKPAKKKRKPRVIKKKKKK